ncbi:MAG: hypothetical protein Q8R57_11830 [Bacteroidota bacterium]|nr:hypothetical protein [Bacteroidota bacterium]
MEKACLTTTEIINGREPIYSILRDVEDEWQFFGKDEPNDDKIMVVSIDKIWKLFPDIKLLCDGLEKGFCAYRNDVNSKWLIEKYE